ncbi:hypothetical protein RFI_18823 [Reticulomyxa filosa]|uniref:Uncharacterized protein n=1 Tax=Reticulomyxa filosa TaxID=46433 RepID=X6MZF9_RETFI|nr:hypothetical protein RFI_18823 [Reticulomyxa filosa]|eukprot:ETO18440.1 hypothetical protein RFI_18823 [Reticulomyxa filosa]
MSLFKAYVNDGEKMHTIILPRLTMEHLKQQILQVTQSTHVNEVLEAIIDRDGNHIETDESLVHAFNEEIVYLTVQFKLRTEDISRVDEIKLSITKKEDISDALDFKKHWGRYWRKANVQAAKTTEEMIHDNEKGLIIVAYNTLKWKNNDDNLLSIIKLMDNKKDDIKEFGEYCMYVIRRKLIVLEQVNIHGNVYIIDCELQCRGEVNITTQIFIAKNAIIDKKLKQCISPIQWSTQIHHNIPIKFQDIEDQEEQYTKQKLYDRSIFLLRKYLQTAIDTFGVNHHYVAIAYNLLALVHSDRGQFKKAIELFENALKILFDIFGIKCSFVAQLYINLGHTYNKTNQYDKAIDCCTKALKIQLEIFGVDHVYIARSYNSLGISYKKSCSYHKANECYENALRIVQGILGNKSGEVADSIWNLGCLFEALGDNKTASKYFEESWKIYSALFGEWGKETLQARGKVKKFE